MRRSPIRLDPLSVAALALAALAAAVASHAGIESIGDLLGGAADDDAYARHAHASVLPVMLASLAGLLVAALRSIAHVRAREERCDPLLLVARRLGRAGTLLPFVTVFAGSLLTLTGMECFEQVEATGHFAGMADVLGGNAAIGLAILGCVAFAVSRCIVAASMLLARTSQFVARFVERIVRLDAGARTPPAPADATRRVLADAAMRLRLAVSARAVGRRGPPVLAIA